jgi:hypothetical protein
VVSQVLRQLLTAALVWAVASTLVAWAGLSGRSRRSLALVTSASGLVFLLLALSTEGLRETQSTAVLLLGTPYVTSLASASASLPYYVLTGLCLLLGTLGLAVSDSVAIAAHRRPMATAISVSLLILLIRFLLEKAAAPAAWTRLFGVTWLAPVIGGYFWLRLRAEGREPSALFAQLALYALAVRSAVALLYLTASGLRLGSHYDLSSVVAVQAPWGSVYHFSPGSFAQVLNLVMLPQLVAWPVYTVLTGLIGGAVVQVAAGSNMVRSPIAGR